MGPLSDSSAGEPEEPASAPPGAADDPLPDLFAALPLPAWIEAAGDGRLLAANDALAALLGLPLSQILGQPIDRFRAAGRPPSVVDQIEDLVDPLAAGRRVVLRAGDGAARRFDLAARPLGYAAADARLVVAHEAAQHARWERMLGAFFSSANEGICVTGPDRTIRFANARFAAMLGYAPDDLVGQHGSAVMPNLDQREPEAIWARRVDAAPAQFDAALRHRDGHPVWVLGAAWPLLDTAGQIAGVIAIIRDVTARKLDDDRYRALAAIVESSADAIIGVDLRGRITSWNAGAEQLYGFTAGEAVGLAREILVPGDRRDEGLEFLAKTLAGEVVGPMETVRRRKDGALVHVSLSGFPVRDAGGAIVGTATIARDITARKRAEEQLREVEHRLVQAQRLNSLATLAGGVAHDFNNLLVGMLGNADLALTAVEPGSELHQIATEIRDSALRAAELSRQMLAYSGRSRFDVRRLDLSEAVAAMEEFLRSAAGANAALELVLEDGLPHVDIDAAEVGQVVLNLVRNAGEALPGPGTVRVATCLLSANRAFLDEAYVAGALPEGPYVALVVEDSGSGMAPDVRAHVFEPFFSTRFTGRGLGLAATVGIVRGHGGCIHVASEPGAGSRFTVLLPPAG